MVVVIGGKNIHQPSCGNALSKKRMLPLVSPLTHTPTRTAVREGGGWGAFTAMPTPECGTMSEEDDEREEQKGKHAQR